MIGAFKPRLTALLEKTRQEAMVRAVQQAHAAQQPPGGVPNGPPTPQQPMMPHAPMAGTPHLGASSTVY